MPLSAKAASLAEVLDEMTAEAAPELIEHLENGALRCYACGHRCLIKSGKRGICKVRFNEAGRAEGGLDHRERRYQNPAAEESAMCCALCLTKVQAIHFPCTRAATFRRSALSRIKPVASSWL